MNDSKKDLVIIMCPPLDDHPEAPKDQSQCELFDCPKCKNKMWLSEKKKGALMFSACHDNEILLCCYHCLKKMVKEDPDFFSDHIRVDL